MKANKVLARFITVMAFLLRSRSPPVLSSRLGSLLCGQLVRPTSTRSLSGAPRALQVRGRRRRVKYYYVLCNGSHC